MFQHPNRIAAFPQFIRDQRKILIEQRIIVKIRQIELQLYHFGTTFPQFLIDSLPQNFALLKKKS